MKRSFSLILSLFLIVAFISWSCNKSHICPAYQSAFLLDQKKAEKLFIVRLGPDTLPLDENIKRKDQYLLALYQSRKKKAQMMSTIVMEQEFFPMQHSDSLRVGLIRDSVAINEKLLIKQQIKEYFQKQAEEEQRLIDSDVSDTVFISNDNFIDRNKKNEKTYTPIKPNYVAPTDSVSSPPTPQPIEVVTEMPTPKVQAPNLKPKVNSKTKGKGKIIK